jgi:YidC/Oxa1 family membrane protein insertase
MINIFNSILYYPLFNALILLYEYLPGHDFGVAIIVLTLIIRLILYPMMAKSIKSQKVLNEIQPRIQEIQKQYANDKEKQAKAMMELYQKEKFNPFGGCLPLLIQLPILFALYRVFLSGFGPEQINFLYNFVPNPGTISQTFLGIVDLAKPNMVLAFLAGLLQFFQSKMVMPSAKNKQGKDQMSQFSGAMQKQMIYMMPLFTFFILFKLPAAIGLYWVATTGFSIAQQYIIYHAKNNPPENPSDAQARA